jgi:hypothetical protein
VDIRAAANYLAELYCVTCERHVRWIGHPIAVDGAQATEDETASPSVAPESPVEAKSSF